MKLTKPAEMHSAAEYAVNKRKRSKRPPLWRRAAGIGSRAKWDSQLERYVIGEYS